MNVKTRRRVEQKVVSKFVRDFITNGFRLTVSHERGFDVDNCLVASTDYTKIMEEASACDECHIFVHEPTGEPVIDGGLNAIGWVWFVYGNDGWDVLSDYTTNLEIYLKGVHQLSNELEKRYV